MLSMISYDIDVLLIKDTLKFDNSLTPKMSFRISPNDTKNIKDEERYLNTDNIFSLNRIGFNETLESGMSLTLGLDFEKKHKDSEDNFLSSKIATVFRDENNENLPTSSTLGKKRSDIVGEIDFNPSKDFTFKYNYSLSDDLNEINLHKFINTFNVNNFVNTFTFYEENNLIGDKSYYENAFTYNFDKKIHYHSKLEIIKKTI